VPVKHRFVSAKPDSGDTSVVRPQADWNDGHVLSGGTNGQMLVRDDTQTDGWRWENPAGTPSTLPTLDVAALTVSDTLNLNGFLTPPQINATQNNYAPTGIGTAITLRLSSDASRQITGIVAPASGRILMIHNIGAQDIVLMNESGSSTLANRFALGSDVTLQSNRVAFLQYDGASARWRAVSGGGGGVAAGNPGGASGQVQFNSSGVFGGDAGLQYDAALDKLTGTNVTVTGTLEVTGTGAGFSEYTTGNLPVGQAGTVRVGAQLGNVLSVSMNGGAITPIALIGGDLGGTATAPIVDRISTALELTGIVTVPTLTADTDDLNPANLAVASTLRLGTDATRNLTGIAGGSQGRVLILMNVGSNALILKNATTSAGANQFQFGSDVLLPSNQGMAIQYDSTSSKWRAIGYPPFSAIANPTYGASVAINGGVGRLHRITVTNATPFTIENMSNPVTGQVYTIMIRNFAGATLGAATWANLYKMAAWVQPGISMNRSVTFVWDGGVAVEIARTATDIPN
jgi:hypothetical protein